MANFEEKAIRENKILADFREMLQSKLGKWMQSWESWMVCCHHSYIFRSLYLEDMSLGQVTQRTCVSQIWLFFQVSQQWHPNPRESLASIVAQAPSRGRLPLFWCRFSGVVTRNTNQESKAFVFDPLPPVLFPTRKNVGSWCWEQVALQPSSENYCFLWLVVEVGMVRSLWALFSLLGRNFGLEWPVCGGGSEVFPCQTFFWICFEQHPDCEVENALQCLSTTSHHSLPWFFAIFLLLPLSIAVRTYQLVSISAYLHNSV